MAKTFIKNILYLPIKNYQRICAILNRYFAIIRGETKLLVGYRGAIRNENVDLESAGTFLTRNAWKKARRVSIIENRYRPRQSENIL